MTLICLKGLEVLLWQQGVPGSVAWGLRATGTSTKRAARRWVYLATHSLDPTGEGSARWIGRWKAVFTVFVTSLAGR